MTRAILKSLLQLYALAFPEIDVFGGHLKISFEDRHSVNVLGCIVRRQSLNQIFNVLVQLSYEDSPVRHSGL
jgi:hypothetical protein